MPEVRLSLIVTWNIRFDSQQTPRQALINGVKDAVRSEYGQYETSIKDDFVAIRAEDTIREIISLRTHNMLWVHHVTPMGTEHKLSPLGVWLVKIVDYFSNMSDKQYERLITDVIRKVG